MPTYSDANLGRIAYERESAFNTANSPFAAQIARITSSSFAANKQTVVSNELRADRMVGDLVETAFQSGGEFGFELSLGGTFDDFLESLLAGTFANAIAVSSASITVTALSGNVESTGGFANAIPGQYILIAGATESGNNGWHKIDTVTDNDNVVLASTTGLVDETWTGDITSSVLRNPGDATNIVKRSYNIEQYFSDIDVAQLYLGQRLASMALTVAANQLVTGTLAFQGGIVTAKSGTGDYADTVTNPTSTDIVGATANVAAIDIAGAVASCLVQSIDLNVDNALRYQNSVGSKYPCGIGYGRQNVSGTLVAYFQDTTIYNLFLNHTDVAISWGFTDNAGNGLHFALPRVKIGTDTPNLEGIDTDVVESLDFQAIAYDPGGTEDPYQIQICRATPA